METKTGKKKVRYALKAGSRREIQTRLENRRQESVLQDQLPIINNRDLQMRINQFRFVQKDIRPIVEDSAWSLAVRYFHIAARKRIKRQMKDSSREGKGRNIYPFRLRFIGCVKGIKTIIVAEKPVEIKSDEAFESRLKEVLNKCREFLAVLSIEKNSTLFDFELTMQTIQFIYEHDNVRKLD